MADYKLSYTAEEIDSKLGRIDNMPTEISNMAFAMAKAYADSQRLAYAEDRSITFDGDISGKEMYEGHVRISEEPIDLNLVESITASTITPEGELLETLTKDKWSVLDEGSLQMIIPERGSTSIIISVHQPIQDDASAVVARGVYVAYFEEDNQDGTKFIAYTSSIKMPEIVHGVDPKFLPEGGFGYTEKAVYAFDYHGDINDPRLIYIDGDVAVKLSDSVVDLNNVSNISMTFDGNTQVVTDELIVSQPTDTVQFLQINISGVLVSLISEQGSNAGLGSIGGPGLYVGVPRIEVGEGVEWTFSVEFKDTMHGIDPKYLPEDGFGYTTFEPNVITFDGNSNGKTAFSYNDYSYMVKVADSISSLEDIIEIVVTLSSGGELRIPVTPSDIGSIPPGKWIQTSWENLNIGRQPLVMLLNDYYDYEAGFYIWTAGSGFPDSGYVSKVIFKGEIEIHHKISPKYLPEGLGYISEEPESVPVYDIIWNDPDRSGYDIPVVDPYGLALRRLFDYTIDLNDVVSVSCFSTGNIEIYEKDGEDRFYFVTDEHSISIPWNDGMRQIVVVHPESFEQDGEQWPAGTYVYAEDTRYSLYEIVMFQIHKIDPKFLPSDIPTKSYIEELIEETILGAIGGSY